MSADRWSVCPDCYAQDQKKLDAMRKQQEESYGKVSKAQYEQKAFEIRSLADKLGGVIKTELREDWEIIRGETEDSVQFKYSCSCYQCGYNYRIDKTWTPAEILAIAVNFKPVDTSAYREREAKRKS